MIQESTKIKLRKQDEEMSVFLRIVIALVFAIAVSIGVYILKSTEGNKTVYAVKYYGEEKIQFFLAPIRLNEYQQVIPSDKRFEELKKGSYTVEYQETPSMRYTREQKEGQELLKKELEKEKRKRNK